MTIYSVSPTITSSARWQCPISTASGPWFGIWIGSGAGLRSLRRLEVMMNGFIWLLGGSPFKTGMFTYVSLLHVMSFTYWMRVMR